MTTQSFNDMLHCPDSPRVKTVDLPSLDIPLHFHDSCELIYIEEGFGTRIVGDRTCGFTNGDMLLVGPNLPHTMLTSAAFQQEKLKVKGYVIYFKPKFLREICPQTPDHAKIAEFLDRSQRGISFYGDTQRQVAEKLRTISQTEGLRKIILFLEIVELMIRSDEYDLIVNEAYNNSFTRKDIARFNDIHNYILANFQNEISLNEAAAVAKMSPKAFCRYFKKHTGKSLIQFVNEQRIGHACRLLQKQENSISQVCFDSGYNNLTHFNNSFKQIHNTTPSEYRKTFLLL